LAKGHIAIAAAMDSSDLDPHLTHGLLGSHDSAPSFPSKQHCDRFNRLCTAQLTRMTNTQTRTQTTLRATSVATGRIYALRACERCSVIMKDLNT